MRKTLVILAIVGSSVASISFFRLRHGEVATSSEPVFIDPPPGPKAPHRRAFGVADLGRMTVHEAEETGKQYRLDCQHASMKALLARMRSRTASRAHGEGLDAVSSASQAKLNAHVDTPQVRLSCEGRRFVPFPDRKRDASIVGRVLFVFDSEAHPLRHMSYRQRFRDTETALVDIRAARSAFEAQFGPPHKTRGRLPVLGGERDVQLRTFERVEFVWQYSDLKLTVSLMGLGQAGVSVYESVEIPWPVRAQPRVFEAPERG